MTTNLKDLHCALSTNTEEPPCRTKPTKTSRNQRLNGGFPIAVVRGDREEGGRKAEGMDRGDDLAFRDLALLREETGAIVHQLFLREHRHQFPSFMREQCH